MSIVGEVMTTHEAKQLVQNLLATTGFEIDDIEERYDDIVGSTVFNILSPEARHLIGKNGDVIRSLNYLAHKACEQKVENFDEIPEFSLDVDDYYKKRMEKLKGQVTMLADRVRSFKSNFAMEPMSPYERLVVHNIVSAIPDIVTESEGEGRERHIVLKYQEV